MTAIAVLDDWQKVARTSADWEPVLARADVEFFHAPFADEEAAAQALQPFDIVLAIRERTPFPSSLVQRLPKLRMFGMTGARAALIDVAALNARGVTVCYTGGGPSGASTAELALGLMLAAARGIPAGDAAVRAGRFQQGTRAGPVLAGRTLGVIGLGRIGTLMARYGRALDMRVLAWSQNLTAQAASAGGALLASKDDLLSEADVVSLHLVLSERTRGVLGAAELARMKRGAILVNTARAALVDETALIDAVRSRRVIAALDVFHREPLPATHPLVGAPDAVLAPHLGYSAVEVYAEYYRHTVENVLAFLDGKPIRVIETTAH
ncbi:MAG TPA: D-2-hydroxyacid dehydrogenase family protein [Casimicrobiaceae bacterium]|nr:D-2-hydroxyacid dehydrogenase family protein [Casimicrobiaceae bacterium]